MFTYLYIRTPREETGRESYPSPDSQDALLWAWEMPVYIPTSHQGDDFHVQAQLTILLPTFGMEFILSWEQQINPRQGKVMS